jgi:predicted GNAT family acetyltransferase
MKLVPLSPENEARFWEIVKQDYLDYFFFIYDWELQKSQTQIYFAVNSDAVAGLMLIYDNRIVQLRGEKESVRFLLNNLNLPQVDVQIPEHSESLLLEKYPRFTLKEKVILMSIKRGQAQPDVSVCPQRLTVNDAGAVADLMHVCYPEMWSSVSADNVAALMNAKDAIWIGIKNNDQLAAFGYAMKNVKVSHITWIATKPQFQCRGYATSIVTSLIKECLAFSEEAIIYVIEDNSVAKHIYQKTGFKPYKSYVFLKT